LRTICKSNVLYAGEIAIASASQYDLSQNVSGGDFVALSRAGQPNALNAKKKAPVSGGDRR
jgi:hypothetical protein